MEPARGSQTIPGGPVRAWWSPAFQLPLPLAWRAGRVVIEFAGDRQPSVLGRGRPRFHSWIRGFEMATDSEFSIVHFSDAHLYGDPTHEIYGVNPAFNLRVAIRSINTIRPRPALCLYTGDSVSEQTEAAYRLFKAEMESLSLPVYYAVGNHDDRKSLRSHLLNEAQPTDDPYYYCFHQSGWRLIVLDTAEPGKVWGSIGDEQLTWLNQLLQDREPTLVFMHHHPLAVGVSWMDELMLKNADPLLQILQRSGCVEAVFFGHIHFECHLRYAGLHFMSVPALSFQFGEGPWTQKSVSLPAGFRLITIRGHGLRTVVHRLTAEELRRR